MQKNGNTIEFRFDEANDVVIARPIWHLRTEDDCKTWYRQFENYFSSLNRGPVDLIILLDDFILDRNIATVWGTYRVKMITTFTRYSIRVNASRVASTAAHTSGVIHGAPSDEAPNVPSAVDQIRRWRAKEFVQNSRR